MDLEWSITNNPEKEFHERRKRTIGSSDIPIILGISPWKTPLDLWKVKTGKVSPEEQNFAQARGTEMEPFAREWLNKRMKANFEPKVFSHNDVDAFTASLDGYDSELNEAVEIKFNGEKNHALAKEGLIPEYYLAQIHWQYIVCPVSKIYYLSYRDGDEVVLDVPKPTEERTKELIYAAANFLEMVKSEAQPPLDKRDYLEAVDKDALKLAGDYEYIKSVIEVYETKLDETKTKLVCIAQALGHEKVSFGSIKMSKTEKGTYKVWTTK